MATIKAGLMKEDDDVELELGLSLGGSGLKKPETPTVKNENFNQSVVGFSDRVTKREIHALRRQEANRKREEKLLQRNRFAAVNNNAVAEFDGDDGGDDHARECKRNRIEENGIKNVNLNLTVEENNVMRNHGNLNVVMPLPCNYIYQQNPSLFMNGGGLAYANAVPYWVPVTAGERTPANFVGQSFGGLPNVIIGPGLLNSKTISCASPIRSSSLGSDNQSSSHEGGGSSDTKSRYTLPEQTQLNGSNKHSASSHLTEISRVSDESRNYTENNIIQSGAAQSNPSISKEESTTNHKNNPKSVLPNPNNASHENKGDASIVPQLPYMPYVSTTGDGPHGKTINGFLYRHTKTDVSIVCVCHGTSFSPAEFVQHAGGTNVTQPLKHITVTPSAF